MKLLPGEIEKIESWLYNTSTGRRFLSAFLSLLNPSLCNIAPGRNRVNSN